MNLSEWDDLVFRETLCGTWLGVLIAWISQWLRQPWNRHKPQFVMDTSDVSLSPHRKDAPFCFSFLDNRNNQTHTGDALQREALRGGTHYCKQNWEILKYCVANWPNTDTAFRSVYIGHIYLKLHPSRVFISLKHVHCMHHICPCMLVILLVQWWSYPQLVC